MICQFSTSGMLLPSRLLLVARPPLLPTPTHPGRSADPNEIWNSSEAVAAQLTDWGGSFLMCIDSALPSGYSDWHNWQKRKGNLSGN